jgi:hypothetical protein
MSGERFDSSNERQRHEKFVGREALLARLDALLADDGDDRWLVVTGGPGMGKSAILSAWLTRREATGEQVSPEALQALLEREIGPETKDIIVTPGQQLIEQGRQQGLEQGLEQGRQQAIQALLLRQLRLRFGDAVDSHVEQRVATASAEELETWSMRVLSAATLAELFAS